MGLELGPKENFPTYGCLYIYGNKNQLELCGRFYVEEKRSEAKLIEELEEWGGCGRTTNQTRAIHPPETSVIAGTLGPATGAPPGRW